MVMLPAGHQRLTPGPAIRRLVTWLPVLLAPSREGLHGLRRQRDWPVPITLGGLGEGRHRPDLFQKAFVYKLHQDKYAIGFDGVRWDSGLRRVSSLDST